MANSKFFNRRVQNPCPYFQAIGISLCAIATEQSMVSSIIIKDSHKALKRAHSWVGPGELERFQKKGIEELGQDG